MKRTAVKPVYYRDEHGYRQCKCSECKPQKGLSSGHFSKTSVSSGHFAAPTALEAPTRGADELRTGSSPYNSHHGEHQ